MIYCTNCLQPNTRPNEEFLDGTCSICRYYLSTPQIDWEARYEQLLNYLKNKKRKSVKNSFQKFDCLIGVSGGKDSARQAIWVRDKLGLNPLLWSLSYPPEQIVQVGVDNVSNLINLGFDMVISSPAPETWRKLIRESFFKFSNHMRASELALFSSVPQAALAYKIPIIFWGETPLQVGDLGALGKDGWDGNNMKNSNTLSSGHKWMIDLGYTQNKLIPYVYPDDDQFKLQDLQIIYLGWYLGDWSLVNNAIYSNLNGLSNRDNIAKKTGDIHGTSALDDNWQIMNQMIKYYKFGFGFVTEIVCEDLQRGLIDRETGIKWITKYDGKCSSEYISSFCGFINISIDEFWDHIRKSANKNLFEIRKNGEILPKFTVGANL
ncbi:N-acetyl sugar amidotransferase [Amylibacter sp.]|nr:N-acetyl sugar amidotransferase [Amylibacter sp.]